MLLMFMLVLLIFINFVILILVFVKQFVISVSTLRQRAVFKFRPICYSGTDKYAQNDVCVCLAVCMRKFPARTAASTHIGRPTLDVLSRL